MTVQTPNINSYTDLMQAMGAYISADKREHLFRAKSAQIDGDFPERTLFGISRIYIEASSFDVFDGRRHDFIPTFSYDCNGRNRILAAVGTLLGIFDPFDLGSLSREEFESKEPDPVEGEWVVLDLDDTTDTAIVTGSVRAKFAEAFQAFVYAPSEEIRAATWARFTALPEEQRIKRLAAAQREHLDRVATLRRQFADRLCVAKSNNLLGLFTLHGISSPPNGTMYYIDELRKTPGHKDMPTLVRKHAEKDMVLTVLRKTVNSTKEPYVRIEPDGTWAFL